MSLPIWIYWEGERPAVIDLCIRSVQHYNDDVRVIGPDDVQKLGGYEILQRTGFTSQPRTGNNHKDVPKAIRSDLIRFWLLTSFGGVWLDSDMVCLDRIGMADEAEEYDMIAVKNIHGQPTPNTRIRMLAAPFGGRKGSPIMEKAFEDCLHLVNRMMSGQYIPYSKTSVGCLSKAIHTRTALDKIKIYEHWKYNRISWAKAHKLYLAKKEPIGHEYSDSWNPNGILYHLTNPIVHAVQDDTETELLEGKSFLSFLFQKAFSLYPAIPHRSKEILNRLPKEPCKMIEVGVLRGDNSRNVLAQHKGLTAICVDPWQDIEDKTYQLSQDHVAFKKPHEWKKTYRAAKDGLAFAGDRCKMLRKVSKEARPEVSDKVNLIFIDANHSYQAVATDIDLWKDSVVDGGYIGGHDYGNPRFPGVKKAVDEYAAKIGATVEVGGDNSWFIKVVQHG